jgi:hypothetical protein
MELAQGNTLVLNNVVEVAQPPQLQPAPVPLQPAPLPPSQRLAPLDIYWQARAVRNLALKACQSPANISDDDIATLGGFPTGSEILNAANFAASLSGCSLFVFNRIIATNHPGAKLTGPMILRWATDSKSHPVTHPASPARGRDEPPDRDDGCSGGEDAWHPRHCPG